MPQIVLIDQILQLLSKIAIIVGLFFTAKQIKNSIKIHKDNLDWNKRKAAQDALLSNNQNDIVIQLRNVFNYNNITEPLPLEIIFAKFGEDQDLQNGLQRLLDMYEAFARGIKQNIYDEEVIKSARKNSMLRAWNIFQTYIRDRRTKINPLAWRDFESLVNEWNHETTRSPKRKGSEFEK